jgi:hypothetical protein
MGLYRGRRRVVNGSMSDWSIGDWEEEIKRVESSQEGIIIEQG